MKKKQLIQVVGVLGIACMVLLAVYFVLNQQDSSFYADDSSVNTEAQALLGKDIDRNYPATVREVINLYSRISRCLYNEKLTEQEFSDIITMIRKLFDEELLEENPLLTYTDNLKNEIQAAKQNGDYMTRYQVQKQSSVVTWETDGEAFASIIACYTLNNSTKTYEEFLLREDENERWKIVGWRLTDPVEIGD